MKTTQGTLGWYSSVPLATSYGTNGTLDIASTLGAGTTVTVTLPAADAEEALGITGAAPKAPETPSDPEGEN